MASRRQAMDSSPIETRKKEVTDRDKASAKKVVRDFNIYHI